MPKKHRITPKKRIRKATTKSSQSKEVLSFMISSEFNVTPAKLYAAFLSSAEHAKMTGYEEKDTHISSKVGEHFSLMHYISGQNVELVPNKKIVQTWRTS